MQVPSKASFEKRTQLNARVYGLVQQIRQASKVETACEVIADYIAAHNATLLTVKFSDWTNEQPSIRAYANYPNSIDAIMEQLIQFGGCPMTKESRERLLSFSYRSIDRRKYASLLERRFFQETDKLGYCDIAILPVIAGRGIVIATVGLDQVFDEKMQAQTNGITHHVAAALLSNFPQIAQLFDGSLLSELEVSILTAYCQGSPTDEICDAHNISPHALRLIWKSAEEKLEARNPHQAIYRAIEMGELDLPNCFEM